MGFQAEESLADRPLCGKLKGSDERRLLADDRLSSVTGKSEPNVAARDEFPVLRG